MNKRIKTIPPLPKLANNIKKSLDKKVNNLGLFYKFLGISAVSISKALYLSGPRPQKLGVISGDLRKKIIYDLIKTKEGMTLRIGTGVFYGKYHEQLEGRGSGRLPKRPFLVPAIADALSKAPDSMLGEMEWRKAIKKILMAQRKTLRNKR